MKSPTKFDFIALNHVRVLEEEAMDVCTAKNTINARGQQHAVRSKVGKARIF
jgi:hypothetical protein